MAEEKEAGSASPHRNTDEHPDGEDRGLHLQPPEDQVLRDTTPHRREALQIDS